MSQAPPNALEIPIELRWSDQDLLGHVNNAKLMTLAEEARIRSLERLRRQLRLEGPPGYGPADHANRFFAAIKVLVWISRIGNTSYVMQHELIQNGEVCVSVEAVVVMFDSQQQAPMPLPDEVRAALESVAA